MSVPAPKVFVSHASEDKARFVVGFATRLRANGVDAWLDAWEMKPGDSLVDKIFEQGLKSAQAVIIVVSKASIVKPWVRQELNTSVVKRISEGLKIIPLVIDDCEIPGALQSTLWLRIADLDHYDVEFARILDVIFDRSSKPPLGAAPPRFTESKPTIPNLSALDERIFQAIGQREIETNSPADACEIQSDPAFAGVPEQDFFDSISMMKDQGLLVAESLAPDTCFARLSAQGFAQYSTHFIQGYGELAKRLGAMLINEPEVYENATIAERLGQPIGLVNFMLDSLADAHQIVLEKYQAGRWEVVQVLPGLRRAMKE
jgi:hypothetical protein